MTNKYIETAPHFKIVGSGLPAETHFFLNGKDISRYTKSVVIRMGVDMVPIIQIELVANLDGTDVNILGKFGEEAVTDA